MSHDPHKEARLLGAGLEIGETANGLVCPSCKGGAHNDKSFSITRFGTGVKYICFRGKCQFKGSNTIVDSDVPVKRRVPRSYRGSTRALTGSEYAMLYTKFPLWTNRTGIVIDTETGRIIKEIRDPNYIAVGHVARKWPEFSNDWGAKSITYWDMFPDLMHDFSKYRPNQDKVILVEDFVSASVLRDQLNLSSIALLGGHVPEDLILFLHRSGVTDIKIALDANLWGHARRIANRYSLLGVDYVHWESRVDPKDMSKDELLCTFGES